MSTNLIDRLQRAERIVALTGAGISAESGLATFRGPEGLWEGRDPFELATPEAFAADPLTVWRFYSWRRRQAARARPNAAHLALARLERARPQFTLVTQNVDGLHERAGSARVLRLHGSLWRLRCTAEQRERDDSRAELGELPPRCECGGLLRPGVVWFGENLPVETLARAERAARQADLVLVIGTSGMVHPAAGLPGLARAGGAWVVEINPEATAISNQVDERIVGPAGTVLPELLRRAGLLEEERRMDDEKKPAEPEAPAVEEPKKISIDRFFKTELRVARVLEVERVENADKLLKLQVDLGDERRQLVAGVATSYEPEALVGKRIIVVANLKPARIRGVESQGMLLAADFEGRPVVATFEEPVPPGTKVR